MKSNDKIQVVEVTYGLGAVAARDISKGEVVGQFTGTIKEFKDYPESEIPYLLAAGGRDLWLAPEAPERFINHSCEPNLRLSNLFVLTATKDIKKGETLAFAYDLVSEEDLRWLKVEKGDNRFLRWPEAFGFTCECKTPSCRKNIDRNIRIITGYYLPQSDEERDGANRE